MSTTEFDTNAPETVAPTTAIAPVTDVLPIAGTVAAPKAGKGKGKKRPFRLVRPCLEDHDLTEAQGHMIDTLQAWTQAQTDAKLMGRLEASKLLVDTMHECGEAGFEMYAVAINLSEEEAAAMQQVYKVWKRWAKQSARAARAQAEGGLTATE